jgi:hypothetical protein
LNHISATLGWRTAYLTGPGARGASAGYLTVSEVFPPEVRAKAIAVFFAVDAEGKSLEDVATPLSVIAKPAEAIFRSAGSGTVPFAGD